MPGTINTRERKECFNKFAVWIFALKGNKKSKIYDENTLTNDGSFVTTQL